MHRVSRILLLVCLSWSVAAGAHTHLIASVPADQAELATAPMEAVLSFAEPVVMTAVSIQSAAGTPIAVKPLPDGAVKAAHLPLPGLAAGRYRLKWRATSDDGHVMSGEIHFSVAGSTPR